MAQHDLSGILGVCPSVIYKWEKGMAKPRSKAAELAKVLKIKERDLFYPEDDDEVENKNEP